MSLVGNAIAGGVEGALNAATGFVDALFTSDEERLTKAEAMERLRQRPQMAQISVNLAEANHRTVFVAGWRPYIGWVCGTALLYKFLGHPLIAWLVAIFAPHVVPPPSVDIQELVAILLAMLGMAGYRTYEKRTGVAK